MKDESLYLFAGKLNYQGIYFNMFGIVPSEYYFKYEDDEKSEEDENGEKILKKEIDIYNITCEFIKSIYPNSVSSHVIGKFKERVVSCAAEKNDNDVYKLYRYGAVYVVDTYHTPEVRIILEDESLIIIINPNSISLFYDFNITNNFDKEKFVEDLIEKLPKKDDDDKDEGPRISLVSISSTGSYYTIDSEINPVTIDIDKNYNDDFKPAYDAITDFIGSKDRKSGLILLNGEPGTGKTYFIRHLVTEFKNLNFILITPSIAARLASPELMEFLIDNKDSIFILEDCEQVIMDRKGGSVSSAVSSILNMSDGLMSDVFNGKFICTFNSDVSSVDEAILRKGRCFAKYKFGALNKEKTQNLLKNRGINIEEPHEMTLSDIYNYDINDFDNTNKKIGF